MKIISWNLLHSKGATAEQVQILIARHKPDLMLMQEATVLMDTLSASLGGYYARIGLPGRHHGLAAWSRTPFHAPAAAVKLRRGVIVKRVCQIIKTGAFSIANVHLSHGQVLNRLQLRQIAKILPEKAAILGDCNMVGPPLLHGFTEAGPQQGTHRPARLVPLRLDRCFIRNIHCVRAEMLGRGASDHHPILVELTDG